MVKQRQINRSDVSHNFFCQSFQFLRKKTLLKMLLTCCRCEINYSKVAQQEKSPIPIHLDPSVKFFSLRMVYVCLKYCRVFSARMLAS